MSRKPCCTAGCSTEAPDEVSSESSRRSEAHEEWRLDEALAETFPASDPIAISPADPLHDSVPHAPRETGGASSIPDCNVGSGNDLGPAAMETPFDCDYCHAKIPASVAVGLDGADYIYHFCGPQCIEAWCSKVNLLPDQPEV